MSSASKKLIQASAGVGGGDFYSYTIENSLRLDNTSSYLTRTVGSTSNRTKWTYSGWVKFTGSPGENVLFSSGNRAYLFTYFATVSDSLWFVNYNLGSVGYVDQIISTAVFRDYAGWCHIVCAYDSAQGTASNRVKLYVNGERITSFSTANYPTVGFASHVNESGYRHRISGLAFNNADEVFASGYQAEPVLIDGQALDPTSFGEDKNGVWIPKDVSGLTFGTNGFYLDFADSANFGNDVSGNNNDFTSSGLTSSDQMIDTPTNNFATLNPVNVYYSNPPVFAEGNLQTGNTSSGWRQSRGNMAVNSGKWYFEARPSAVGSLMVGVMNPNTADFVTQAADGFHGYYAATGGLDYEGSVVATYPTYTSGDIIGVYLNIDDGEVSFYKNGTLVGTRTTIVTGEYYHAVLQVADSSTTAINFGQNGTFNGAITAGGNSDANGLGDFKYTVPTGALALCTANLPEPTIGPNSDTLTSEVFAPILYTGNASARSIDVGFQPDFTWIKNRDAADNHTLFDSVRGATKYFSSNNETNEVTDANSLTAFDSIGFDLGTSSITNGNTEDYVSWNWRKGADYGLDVVTYSGTGTAKTVAHSLGVVPSAIIVAHRDNNGTARVVYHKGTATDPQTDALVLGGYSPVIDDPSWWNDTAPTSSVFTVGNNPATNQSGKTYVAYAFAEVEGFSKLGSYTGNSSTDGPFVYCGFRPAFILMRSATSNANWWMLDDKRPGYNEIKLSLIADEAVAEFLASTGVDILSNGFKIRAITGNINASGQTHIFMAFAENPFKYSNAR